MDPQTGQFNKLMAEGLSGKPAPVPAHWPIFALGEIYEIDDSTFELIRVTAKDLEFSLRSTQGKETTGCVKGQLYEIKGYKFRMRTVEGYVFRPEVGRPRNYMEEVG